jgi:predicted enzyme related to lactoylglutathione lyase
VKHSRSEGCFVFRDQEQANGPTVVAFFPANTMYFGPTDQRAMLNIRVEGMDLLLDELATNSATVDPHREAHDYGNFAWIIDPEGNRVELRELPKK